MSQNAALDVNSKQTILARLKTDGISPTRLTANPSTGALGVTTNTVGAVVPEQWAGTDENGRTAWFAVSENDGVTPVALQCDSSGNLLIKLI